MRVLEKHSFSNNRSFQSETKKRVGVKILNDEM